MKKVYILKNLGCAHCAAKMEHRIKELPGVEYANISYVTKQLRLSAVNHEAVLPAIKEICTSIESGVEVVPREGEGPFNFKTQVYVLENLGCANCAAKMERAINELPQVSEATITFATKQLKVTARDFDGRRAAAADAKNLLRHRKRRCRKRTRRSRCFGAAC